MPESVSTLATCSAINRSIGTRISLSEADREHYASPINPSSDQSTYHLHGVIDSPRLPCFRICTADPETCTLDPDCASHQTNFAGQDACNRVGCGGRPTSCRPWNIAAKVIKRSSGERIVHVRHDVKGDALSSVEAFLSSTRVLRSPHFPDVSSLRLQLRGQHHDFHHHLTDITIVNDCSCR
jgi:hypothetical protein